MIEAHSLDSIKEVLSVRLERNTRADSGDAMVEIGYMTALEPCRPFLSQVADSPTGRDDGAHLLGILFCAPGSPLGREEVTPNLDFFHHDSGKWIDFFCVGYGAYWPPEHFADEKVVATIRGVNWKFSAQAFFEVVAQIEAESAWRYERGTELLLLTVKTDDEGQAILDYDSAISFDLERLVRIQAIDSVRFLFGHIFQMARTGRQAELFTKLLAKTARDGVEGGNVLADLFSSLFNSENSSALRSAIRRIGPSF